MRLPILKRLTEFLQPGHDWQSLSSNIKLRPSQPDGKVGLIRQSWQQCRDDIFAANRAAVALHPPLLPTTMYIRQHGSQGNSTCLIRFMSICATNNKTDLSVRLSGK